MDAFFFFFAPEDKQAELCEKVFRNTLIAYLLQPKFWVGYEEQGDMTTVAGFFGELCSIR